MANTTREQFDESKGVIRKVLQKGVYITDADWNEAMQALVMARRRVLSAAVYGANCRLGDGFKVVGTGATLTVTVKAGRAIFHVGTQQAVMLHLANDLSLGGFSSFSAGSPNAYVYVDIWEDEVTAATDPNIVNPDIGQETCVDLRSKYQISVSQPSAPGTPPSGHTYVTIATITSNDNVLTAGEVAINLPLQEAFGDGSVTTPKLADLAVTGPKIAEGTIPGSKLAAATIPNAAMAANSVDTGNVVDGAITAPKVAAAIAGLGLARDGSGVLSVDGINGGSSRELKVKIIDIGDWNMDINNNTVVNHSYPELQRDKIRDVSAIIRTDDGSLVLPLNRPHGGSPVSVQGSVSWDNDYFLLQRLTSGTFDSTSYDSTSYNRGWITIWYEA